MDLRRLSSLCIVLLLFSACSQAVPTATQPPANPLTAPTSPNTPVVQLPATQPPVASASETPAVMPAAQESSPTAPPDPTPVVPPPQNVILIIVDTLRAGHLPAYGYDRPTTPNLDAWLGDKGVRFERVLATSPWTCPSVAAMFTGRNPTSLGVSFTSYTNSISQQEKTLAEYLHEAGYYTAGFATTYCVKGKLGFSQGFDYYDDSLSDLPTSNKARAAQVNQLAMEWLQNDWLDANNAARPLFLLLYYFDPHVWYDPPSPFDVRYDPDYTGSLTPQVYQNGEEIAKGNLSLSDRDVYHLKALYDGEISYWDDNLGKMLTFLQENRLMDNTLVVVTSDHGEQFGEHDKWAHGNSLYEEVLRVPMYMRYDGIIPPGTVVTSPVQNFDLMPTILEWAGTAPPQNLDAVSLQAVAQAESDGDFQRPLYSEVDGLTDRKNALYWTAPRVSLRSIEQGDWKLIHVLEQMDQDELYALQPGSLYEDKNILSAEPQRYQEMLQGLSAWFNLR